MTHSARFALANRLLAPRLLAPPLLAQAACASVGALGLAGCGSAPHTQQPAPAAQPLTATIINDGDWRSLGYRVDWRGYPFASASGPGAIRDVSISADAIALQDSATNVSVLEGSTGQLRWSVQLANPLTKFVALSRDPGDASRLLASSETELFVLAMSSGNLLGRERLDRVVTTRPLAVPGQLVYGAASGEVFAHRVGVGLRSWGFLGVGSFEAPPIFVGSAGAFVSQSGDVVFIDPTTGNLLGRHRVQGGLASAPVASSDTLFLAGLDQSVWAIGSDGQRRWRYLTPSPLRAQPTLHSNTLYLDVPRQGLTAFDAGSGAVKWNSPTVSGDVVAVRTGKLLVRSGSRVTLVDPARGAPSTSIEVPGLMRLLPDQLADGRLFAVLDDNTLLKLSPR
jgi:outer membrane protein assembly factor BamB